MTIAEKPWNVPVSEADEFGGGLESPVKQEEYAAFGQDIGCLLYTSTGTTDMAGKCLIATAERDDVELLAVALNSSRRYEDCTLMLDYGFALKSEDVESEED